MTGDMPQWEIDLLESDEYQRQMTELAARPEIQVRCTACGAVDRSVFEEVPAEAG